MGERKKVLETIGHPVHYGGAGNPYEVIKVIEAWDLNFRVGSAVKYIGRAAKKGAELEDIQKAIWYLQRELDSLRGYSLTMHVPMGKGGDE